MKIKKSFKIKFDLASLKVKRFKVGAFYFVAGTDLYDMIYNIRDGSYGWAAVNAILIILWIYLAGTERKQIEAKVAEEAKVDGFLEGFKHGLKS